MYAEPAFVAVVSSNSVPAIAVSRHQRWLQQRHIYHLAPHYSPVSFCWVHEVPDLVKNTSNQLCLLVVSSRGEPTITVFSIVRNRDRCPKFITSIYITSLEFLLLGPSSTRAGKDINRASIRPPSIFFIGTYYCCVSVT